ncbi:RNA polymerase sigma factor [Luteipulveratus mongoliensis]|uniref:RNA polymerase sigma factor n=1 Tax=Luteipulveratus mongoliensis TaxID=571913 RepID=UPI0006985DA3|nr:sigma-70 family RNA polymerase sigma factor [Luteipulveratus mongoliensis]
MATTGEDQWRALAPQVLARLLRAYGSDQLDACEDAVQEAMAEAYVAWPAKPPTDPLAWLVTVARRRYVDHVRSDVRRRARETRESALLSPLLDAAPGKEDDSLEMLQLCCHPTLTPSAQITLTLRAVAGLTTQQIGAAMLLPEATVAQRITRAKRRIVNAGNAFPSPDSPDDRLDPVLSVLYLMLTEAHHTATGQPAYDVDLGDEAVRLTRLVHRAHPRDSEVTGLLALMLLTIARRDARISEGELVPLADQDRSLWRRDFVTEALALLEATVPGATPGPYLLQACIAAIHASAADTDTTDWREIAALYRALEQVSPDNPAVRLNRIAAEAMVLGNAHGLRELDRLEADHPEVPRLSSVRAHLLQRVGDREAAAAAYRRAIEQATNIAEQRQLTHRLREVTGNDADTGCPLSGRP